MLPPARVRRELGKRPVYPIGEGQYVWPLSQPVVCIHHLRLRQQVPRHEMAAARQDKELLDHPGGSEVKALDDMT